MGGVAAGRWKDNGTGKRDSDLGGEEEKMVMERKEPQEVVDRGGGG